MPHRSHAPATAPAQPACRPDVPFEAIVEQSVAGIYVIQDDHFVYANSTWAAIAAYTPQEVIGMPLSRIVAPDFLGEVRARVQARLKGNPPSMHFITCVRPAPRRSCGAGGSARITRFIKHFSTFSRTGAPSQLFDG